MMSKTSRLCPRVFISQSNCVPVWYRAYDAAASSSVIRWFARRVSVACLRQLVLEGLLRSVGAKYHSRRVRPLCVSALSTLVYNVRSHPEGVNRTGRRQTLFSPHPYPFSASISSIL